MVVRPEPKALPLNEAESAKRGPPTWIARVNGIELDRMRYEKLAREVRPKDRRGANLLLKRLIDRELLRQHLHSQGQLDPVELQKAVDERISLFGGREAFERFLKARGTSMTEWRSDFKVDFALSRLEPVVSSRKETEVYQQLTGKPAVQPRYRVSSVVVKPEWGPRLAGNSRTGLGELPSDSILARTDAVWVTPRELTPAVRRALDETAPGHLTGALPNPRGPMFFVLLEKSEEAVAEESELVVAREMMQNLERAEARDQLLRELRAKAKIEYADDHRPETP